MLVNNENKAPKRGRKRSAKDLLSTNDTHNDIVNPRSPKRLRHNSSSTPAERTQNETHMSNKSFVANDFLDLLNNTSDESDSQQNDSEPYNNNQNSNNITNTDNNNNNNNAVNTTSSRLSTPTSTYTTPFQNNNINNVHNQPQTHGFRQHRNRNIDRTKIIPTIDLITALKTIIRLFFIILLFFFCPMLISNNYGIQYCDTKFTTTEDASKCIKCPIGGNIDTEYCIGGEAHCVTTGLMFDNQHSKCVEITFTNVMNRHAYILKNMFKFISRFTPFNANLYTLEKINDDWHLFTKDMFDEQHFIGASQYENEDNSTYFVETKPYHMITIITKHKLFSNFMTDIVSNNGNIGTFVLTRHNCGIILCDTHLQFIPKKDTLSNHLYWVSITTDTEILFYHKISDKKYFANATLIVPQQTKSAGLYFNKRVQKYDHDDENRKQLVRTMVALICSDIPSILKKKSYRIRQYDFKKRAKVNGNYNWHVFANDTRRNMLIGSVQFDSETNEARFEENKSKYSAVAVNKKEQKIFAISSVLILVDGTDVGAFEHATHDCGIVSCDKHLKFVPRNETNNAYKDLHFVSVKKKHKTYTEFEFYWTIFDQKYFAKARIEKAKIKRKKAVKYTATAARLIFVNDIVNASKAAVQIMIVLISNDLFLE